MKKREILKLGKEFGENKTLKEIAEEFYLPYECPQCGGNGIYSKKTIKKYPSGLPDSGWVPDEVVYVPTECNLCGGQGWNDIEYKPRLIQDGWEDSK